MEPLLLIFFLIIVLLISLLKLRSSGQSDLVKQEILREQILKEQAEEDKRLEEAHKIKRDNVLSLNEPEIKVSVKGHARRTLELRCGFVMNEEETEISITLLERHNSDFKEEDGDVYLCELQNKEKCFVVGLDTEIKEDDVSWYSKTFYPINHKEWFKYCTAEDMLIKDDESLRPIDRIEWHNKLIEKIEKKHSSSFHK